MSITIEAPSPFPWKPLQDFNPVAGDTFLTEYGNILIVAAGQRPVLITTEGSVRIEDDYNSKVRRVGLKINVSHE